MRLFKAFCAAAISVVFLFAAPAQTNDLPPDPGYTCITWSQARQDFLRRQIVDTYNRVGKKNAAWESDARDFLEKFCTQLAYADDPIPPWPDDLPTLGQLDKLAAALVAKKCNDPLFQFAYGAVLQHLDRRTEAAAQLRRSLAAMEKNKYPPEPLLETAIWLIAVSDELKPAEIPHINDVIDQSAVKIATGTPKKSADRTFLMALLREAIRGDFTVETRINDLLHNSPNIDPWLAAEVSGEFEVHAAWAARGAGWAGEVTAPGWQGFHDHLALARRDLTAAWNIDHSLPGPATYMLKVVMGEEQSQDSLDTWFQRARIAWVDDSEAHTGLLWALYPRWGGSYDQMLAAGISAFQNGRFDSREPLWLLNAVQQIQEDSEGESPHTYSEPAVYSAIQDMFTGYEQKFPTGQNHDLIRNWHALMDWKAGHFDDARSIFDELADRTKPNSFGSFIFDGDLAVGQTFAFTGSSADRAHKADADYTAGDFETAAKEFSALDSETKPDDRALPYYDEMSAILQTRVHFTAGDTVDLLPAKIGRYLWIPREGSWRVNEQNRLVGIPDHMGIVSDICKIDVGKRYTVSAKLRIEKSARSTFMQLALDQGDFKFKNGIVLPQSGPKAFAYIDSKLAETAAGIGVENQLDIDFWDGHFTAKLNGKPLNFPAPDAAPADVARAQVPAASNPSDVPTHLALIVTDPAPDTTVTLWDVTIKKLFAPPTN